MGAEVTVVEVLDRVLPVEDEEVSAFARKSFEKQGIKIHTGATVQALEHARDGVTARIEADGKSAEMAVERVILAVGIVGNVEDIGLENTGVVVEKTHVVIDEWLCTGEPGVYAIGDLVGPPWLAHKASHEGVICVERIAGVNDVHPLDTRNPPDPLDITVPPVTTPAADNVFAALNNLRLGLLANNTAQITAASTSVQLASDRLNTAQSFYGTVQNRISDATNYSANYDVQLKTELSQKEDADITAAALTITQGNIQLQAAFEMQAKMPRTTLFDFMG
jgi:flagellin-like hook-associated protein FlgL